MSQQHDVLGKEFGFHDIDARLSIEDVFAQLRKAVEQSVSDLRPTVN